MVCKSKEGFNDRFAKCVYLTFKDYVEYRKMCRIISRYLSILPAFCIIVLIKTTIFYLCVEFDFIFIFYDIVRRKTIFSSVPLTFLTWFTKVYIPILCLLVLVRYNLFQIAIRQFLNKSNTYLIAIYYRGMIRSVTCKLAR